MAQPTKRTTLTLPASILKRAGTLAAQRQVTLRTVLAEALEAGLANRGRIRRAESVLSAYRAAFSGFNEHERLMLDGVDLEPGVR